MREILRQNCFDLLNESVLLTEIISDLKVTEELEKFHQWTLNYCEYFIENAKSNLRDIDLGQDEILPDLLSEIQSLHQSFQWFNRHLVGHLLRSSVSDRLCLKLIFWLHNIHIQTQKVPFGLNDGDFASVPSDNLPVIYYIPPSTQRRLLYLPLLFHEFGHVLYACHEPEMNLLVKDLQKKIAELLQPYSQRDDIKAKADEQKRRQIVETWFEWTQELFCDAVGLVIGGPAFAKSFSMFLRLSGREAFHIPSDDLYSRTHPITWIRIQLLADRASKMGLNALSSELTEAWTKIAQAILIEEDYFGFYESSFLPFVQKTIDDMLIETEPLAYTPIQDIADPSEISFEFNTDSSLPQLLNYAWMVFQKFPDNYPNWEKQLVKKICDN